MWKGLIIACLTGTPITECVPTNTTTVVEVFRPPTKNYRSLFACQFESMAFAAEIAPKGTFVKVYCQQITKQGSPAA